MKRAILLLGFTLFVSGNLFAQRVNETGAALEYVTFEYCFMQAAQVYDLKEIEACRETYIKAKNYIDKAAVNKKTKNRSRTLFYKGKIYIGSMLAYSTDTTYLKEHLKENIEIGLASLKRAHQDKKFSKDVVEYVNTYKFQFNIGANQMFKEGRYAEAGSLYEYVYKFNDVIGIVDSTSLYNTGMSYQFAEKFEESADMFKKLVEIGYRQEESYINAVTNLISAKKLEEAEKLILIAIKKYPNNKEIFAEYQRIQDLKNNH